MVTYLPSLKPCKLDEQNMQDSAGEARTNLYVAYFNEPLHLHVSMLADQ